MMEIRELFNLLESNQSHTVEDIKKRFHENFNATKEPWILIGLFDYFVQTSSIRCVEIIVSVREPHDKYLFDRIDEGLRQPIKSQALTLLGHVVRRQPPWIYKITQHTLLKNLMKLLKTETEILPLMSALLTLIVLLPMIPAYIGPFLTDIFEIFSRLAAWNVNNAGKLTEEHLVHLQVCMYALFLLLYGMYPCNFVSYLRQEYGPRDHLAVFSHTIKPMLDTVKMHPLLVTASKDAEIGTSRWKKMGHHDVIVECAKFTLDPTERSREDTLPALTSSFRSRSGTEYSASLDSSYQLPQSIAQSSMLTLAPTDGEFFSPSIYFQHSTSPPAPEISAPTSVPQTPVAPSSTPQAIITSSVYAQQEGTSPPEAAIEATPETTPIKDLRLVSTKPVPSKSTVVRAITNFNPAKWTDMGASSNQSQPSSPMLKDTSAFKFPTDSVHSAFEQPRKDMIVSSIDHKLDSFTNQRVSRLMYDRSVTNETGDRSSLTLRSKTPLNQPTSPLRVIPYESSVPNSPVPMEISSATPSKDWHVAKPKPEKNGFRFESPVTQDISQEDQEVVEIVRQGEQFRNSDQSSSQINQHCDSVLQEFHPPHNEEFEECEQQRGSPCSSGGLHMPNSQSMLDFAKRVCRLRYYSHCVTDPSSTGSSPGDRVLPSDAVKVQRSYSCPEMKKSYTVLPSETRSKVLIESDEIENIQGKNYESGATNGQPETTVQKQLITTSCQTIDTWPQPYEHLFLGLFPSVDTANIEQRVPPSPGPSQGSYPVRCSPYEMLDKYIETTKQKNEFKRGYENEMKLLKEQLDLAHLLLQFERHRRDVHAERNRRLMGKAKSNRALEEYNNALREQLALLQQDNEKLHLQLDSQKKETISHEKKLQEDIEYWQNQCTSLQEENKQMKQQKDIIDLAVKDRNNKLQELDVQFQQSQATILDLRNEMHFAINQAMAGEQIRADLEQLQKELLIMGEIHLKYQERFSGLPTMKCRDDEMDLLTETYTQEIEGLNQQLASRNSLLDSTKARITDLETTIAHHDELCAEQKKMLKIVKEEYEEELKSIESKYNTQRAIIKGMEVKMLELHTKIDRLEFTGRKGVRSPDSHGSGKDIGSGDRSGPSPHSSPPLSVSLTSSEGGSMAFLQTNSHLTPGVEMKNLQVIVDPPDNTNATGSNPEQKGKSFAGQSDSTSEK